jgi:hypothetical protein
MPLPVRRQNSKEPSESDIVGSSFWIRQKGGGVTFDRCGHHESDRGRRERAVAERVLRGRIALLGGGTQKPKVAHKDSIRGAQLISPRLSHWLTGGSTAMHEQRAFH